MQFTLFKNKQFMSFLVSYLLILFFFTTVCTYVYYKALSFIEEEVINLHQATITQISQSMDTKITELEWISSELILDKNILSDKALIETKERLRIYLAPRQYITDIFISYPHKNLILSHNGTCSITEYCELYFSNTDKSSQELADLFSKRNLNRRVIINRNCNTSNINDLLFLRSVEYEPTITSYSNVGILLNHNFFQNMQNNLVNEQLGNIVILDNDFSLIYASEPIALEDLTLLPDFAEEKGDFDIKINDAKIKVVYVNGKKGFTSAAIIPYELFTKKARSIKNTMLISIMVYVLFGVVASIIFATKNYRPIYDIIKKFEQFGGSVESKESNSYYQIELIISNIINRNNMIEHLYNKQKENLKDFFLLKLLKGQIVDYASIDDILATYDIHFPFQHFVIIMIYFEDRIEKYEQTDNLEIFILENVLSEYLDNFSIKNCCFHMDDAVFVIANTYDRDIIHSQLKNILEDIHYTISEHFHIQFNSLVSGIHKGYSSLDICYGECMDAAEHMLVFNSEGIVFYDDIANSKPDNTEILFPFAQQQKFINLVKSGDFNGARELVDTVFVKINENNNVSLDVARCSMYAMINTLINVYEDAVFIEGLDVMKRLTRCKSIASLNKEMSDILAHIEQDYNKKQKSSAHNKITDINAYILNNFNDSSLSLTSIAAFFEMNPSYLSHYYKQATGEGILYTINKIRVEETKRLLGNKKYTLREIADLVGFVNDTVLIRTFKKYEGITPGQYRKI